MSADRGLAAPSLAKIGDGAREPFRAIPDLPACQWDTPLDWYQPEIRPYAEEMLREKARGQDALLAWLDSYARPTLEHFGEDLLLLAHHYMGGEIVRLVERYGGRVADSYQLALATLERSRARVIVQSAVHFMAETAAILVGEDRDVWITNPKAGCTMEMWAKEDMVLPAVEAFSRHAGGDPIVVAYMNTSGRIKALAGRTGGAACTSSNAELVLRWALARGRRVLFVPDENLGLNCARAIGLAASEVALLDDPRDGLVGHSLQTALGRAVSPDRARLVLWRSRCTVHTVFTVHMVRWWKARGWTTLVHPECLPEVLAEADGVGSTAYLWDRVRGARAGARLAIATEGHFVRRASDAGASLGFQVRHLAEIPGSHAHGCACAMMSRNDAAHLAGTLDLLRLGRAPDLNRVLAGDVIEPTTMRRERLPLEERATVERDARAALLRMVEIVKRGAAHC